MNDTHPEIKLGYTAGLREVVLNDLNANPAFVITRESDDAVYLEFDKAQFADIKRLKSVARAYITLESTKYHPSYISNHKSILGSLAEIVIDESEEKFKTFKISCAGSDSPEVRAIAKYIEETFNLAESEEADLKIHLIKPEDVWEIGIQITPRPLSVRAYKERNMSGAMDPTVAYALNSFCGLDTAKTYLNAFSGSGTLLIEAALAYPDVESLVGFDNDKKHLSLSIQNIKKAGLIKRVQVREADMMDNPDLGMFDAITSDLPFGMAISKGADLEALYRSFIAYSAEKLNPGGRLGVYTSEYELLEKIISESKFRIIKTLDVESMTAANAYLKTRMIICELTR